MPTQPEIIGFANRWYPLAMTTARDFLLPSGVKIRLIYAPEFLGTRFEAFAGRGQGDLLASHDLEDIINVVAGREQLFDEIRQASQELRAYLSEECGKLLAMPDFDYYVPGTILDDTDGGQVDLVLDRLRAFAELSA